MDGDIASLDLITGGAQGFDDMRSGIIITVFLCDAKDLNDRIDGPTLGVNTGADLKGRVKYADPSGGTTTVYMYLSHR